VKAVRIGVFDEHEVFRRGVVSCLKDEPGLEVVTQQGSGPADRALDVAVASPSLAQEQPFDCPVVVCGSRRDARRATGANEVSAVLPRATLRARHLVVAVWAAANGMRVSQESVRAPEDEFDERESRVLELLSEGASTREIADRLGYSQRTIKGVIHVIERRLGTRSRAHAVAAGIRRGII
jgi:DNA-binding NarL/FixJ family response regulator